MNPEQARKVVQALIELMGAKAANKADPGGAVYAADQVTNPGAVTGFKDTNLRAARQKAREVQGEDPLTPFTAAEHKVETAGMAPSPGKAHLTRTELLGDPSRLPDQGGLDSQLVRVRPQDSPDPNIPFVETRGHRMMRGGLDNPRDPNIEQGLLYPGEPGFEAQAARGGYGHGLSPGSPGYDAINKANLAETGTFPRSAEEAGIRQAEDVLGTTEEMEEVGKQIFRELFPIVAKGEMPDAKLLAQLEDTHPPLADYLKEEMKDQGLLITSRDNPITDDIPF